MLRTNQSSRSPWWPLIEVSKRRLPHCCWTQAGDNWFKGEPGSNRQRGLCKQCLFSQALHTWALLSQAFVKHTQWTTGNGGESICFTLDSPFDSTRAGLRCGAEGQSVWIKMPRDPVIAVVVWKANSAVGTKRPVVVLENKTKNCVKIFAEMPRDWITFWQNHILALWIGCCYFFWWGMSVHSFKLGLNIITFYSFHISNNPFCIEQCTRCCWAFLKDPFWKPMWRRVRQSVYCSSSVTAGYKSWRHSSLRSGHRSVRAHWPGDWQQTGERRSACRRGLYLRRDLQDKSFKVGM